MTVCCSDPEEEAAFDSWKQEMNPARRWEYQCVFFLVRTSDCGSRETREWPQRRCLRKMTSLTPSARVLADTP